MIYLLFNKKTRQYADHHSQWLDVTESAAMKDTEFCLDLEELFECLYYLVGINRRDPKFIRIYLISPHMEMDIETFYNSLSLESMLELIPNLHFIPDAWLHIPEIELAAKLL